MGGRANDLVGRQYGRLFVTKRLPNVKGKVVFECKCSCGTVTPVTASHLKSGHSKSCGCLQKDAVTVDLSGKVIGLWVVMGRSKKIDKWI